MTAKELSQNKIIEEWSPIEIDEAQWVILGELEKNRMVCIKNNKELEHFVIHEGYSDLDDFIEKLLKTRLVTIDGDNLRLLTNQCDRVCIKGKWYAAENVTGRLNDWAMKQMKG